MTEYDFTFCRFTAFTDNNRNCFFDKIARHFTTAMPMEAN